MSAIVDENEKAPVEESVDTAPVDVAECRAKAAEHKAEGNAKFSTAEYDDAIECYTLAFKQLKLVGDEANVDLSVILGLLWFMFVVFSCNFQFMFMWLDMQEIGVLHI